MKLTSNLRCRLIRQRVTYTAGWLARRLLRVTYQRSSTKSKLRSIWKNPHGQQHLWGISETQTRNGQQTMTWLLDLRNLSLYTQPIDGSQIALARLKENSAWGFCRRNGIIGNVHVGAICYNHMSSNSHHCLYPIGSVTGKFQFWFLQLSFHCLMRQGFGCVISSFSSGNITLRQRRHNLVPEVPVDATWGISPYSIVVIIPKIM